MNNQIQVEYSAGRGKYGRQYAYIRPAGNCHNKSRRVSADQVESTIEKHFPNVNYYLINGLVIGAKDPDFALKEFWRVCERQQVGKAFPVTLY